MQVVYGGTSTMLKRKHATRFDYDGRAYLTNRHRKKTIPLSGFLFVMICLWSVKALMLAQNPDSYFATGNVVLDINHPITSLQTLVFYPDPVTVFLAETVLPMI